VSETDAMLPAPLVKAQPKRDENSYAIETPDLPAGM
jgi:hypothetical protein